MNNPNNYNLPRRPRSIDGVIAPAKPAAKNRNIYLSKDVPNTGPSKQSFLSLQPRKSIDGMAIRPKQEKPKLPPAAQLKSTAAHPTAVPAIGSPTFIPPPKAKSSQKTSRMQKYRPSSVIPERDVVVRLPGSHSLRARLFSVVQYIGLTGIALVSAYSTSIGQWLVLIYAIVVIVTRRDSRLSFGIALFLLIAVPIFQLIGQGGIANNIAVYVYEFLVVGVVQAIIELKWPTRAQKQAELQPGSVLYTTVPKELVH